MSDCDFDSLSRFLDAELSLPDRRALLEHLARCPDCTNELDDLRRIEAALARWSAPRERLAPESEMRILAEVDRRRHTKRVRSFARLMPAALGTSIAALLVLVSANIGWLYRGAVHNPGSTRPAHAQTVAFDELGPYVNMARIDALSAGRTTSPPGMGSREDLVYVLN